MWVLHNIMVNVHSITGSTPGQVANLFQLQNKLSTFFIGSRTCSGVDHLQLLLNEIILSLMHCPYSDLATVSFFGLKNYVLGLNLPHSHPQSIVFWYSEV